jgi:hypothetical protein
MTTWTRVVDPVTDGARLPAWFVSRMTAAHGSFGLLLTTGDVLRVTSLTAAHLSSGGTILLDILLDHAGIPDGVDTAWRSKHYLGRPLPGATSATVNLTQVVAVVSFSAEQEVERANEVSGAAANAVSATVVEIRQAAEDAVERQTTSDC